jgi:kynurenine formamidase
MTIRPLLRAASLIASIVLAGASARSAADDWLLSATLVDLTHPFGSETLYWPTAAEGFVLERGFAGLTEGGWYYEAHRFRAPEHGGTHLDAPIHFAAGKSTVDRIPLRRLAAPAVRIDLRQGIGPDHAVSRAELEAWEGRNGRIAEGSIVLLDTGWAARWPDAERYLGTAERGAAAVEDLHFPGLDADGADFLATERRIAAVGIDTASIDPGVSTDFRAHRILFEQEIPALENLADLGGLPARGFSVVALPVKIGGGSGAPLRAIAVVPAAPE